MARDVSHGIARVCDVNVTLYLHLRSLQYNHELESARDGHYYQS